MWAGKALTGVEEARLRRLIHTLQRVGNRELADHFERFLPEREGTWTIDELVEGQQVGPGLFVDAGVHRDDHEQAAT